MKVYAMAHIKGFLRFSALLSCVAIASCAVGGGQTQDGNSSVIRIRRVPIMFSRRMGYSNESLREIAHAQGAAGTVIFCSDSIEDFPTFFTDQQRKQGAFLIPVFIGIYCFTVIAIICDNYFLPCVERICEALDLSQDVAAATFMSIATSAPELFSNIIGTFITESDIGIGTVVGSSMFNTLGVGAIGGLAAKEPIQLASWPLTRDCSIYICSIVLLVWITWDGEIFWYEALILFLIYFLYLAVMFQNTRISNFLKDSLQRLWKRKISTEPIKNAMELSTITTIDEELSKYIEHKDHQRDKAVSIAELKKMENGTTTINITNAKHHESNGNAIPDACNEIDDEVEHIFRFPRKRNWSGKLLFMYSWPIKFLLFCTVPDCRKHRNVFPVTFLMCVFWIAINSYLVSWMVTVIGSTFGIQDSVLGLTFLAAGGCLPEAISITITSRRGEGRMGVSNALGANTMNILLSLGLPWFIKTLILIARHGRSRASIKIVSGSLEYTILALIMVAITLYIVLALNKFQLSWKSGLALICFYLFFLGGAIAAEIVLFHTEACTPVKS